MRIATRLLSPALCAGLWLFSTLRGQCFCNTLTDNTVSTNYHADGGKPLYYGYRYYNASTGRWLSRDPLDADGGLNQYTIADNSVIEKYDVLGQCACGVEDFQLIPRGWTLGHGQAFFTFDVSIRFKKGPGYDCSCCRYIQWLNGTSIVNGSPTGSTSGTPLDGQWHVDSWLYKDDDDTDPIGEVYRNRTGLPCDFLGTDTPGYHGLLKDNTDLHLKFTFRGTVIDTCAGYATEVATTADMTITVDGTYPKVQVTPKKPL